MGNKTRNSKGYLERLSNAARDSWDSFLGPIRAGNSMMEIADEYEMGSFGEIFYGGIGGMTMIIGTPISAAYASAEFLIKIGLASVQYTKGLVRESV